MVKPGIVYACTNRNRMQKLGRGGVGGGGGDTLRKTISGVFPFPPMIWHFSHFLTLFGPNSALFDPFSAFRQSPDVPRNVLEAPKVRILGLFPFPPMIWPLFRHFDRIRTLSEVTALARSHVHRPQSLSLTVAVVWTTLHTQSQT